MFLKRAGTDRATAAIDPAASTRQSSTTTGPTTSNTSSPTPSTTSRPTPTTGCLVSSIPTNKGHVPTAARPSSDVVVPLHEEHLPSPDYSMFHVWLYFRFFRRRKRVLFFVFLFLNLAVLGVRLGVGKINLQYLIRSVIIFLDLTFNNLFSGGWKLQVMILCNTLLWMLLYLFYNQVWMELVETLLLAAVISVYDIWRTHTHRRLDQLLTRGPLDDEQRIQLAQLDQADQASETGSSDEEGIDLETGQSHRRHRHHHYHQGELRAPSRLELRQTRRLVREQSFAFPLLEQFLDGSVGILYTSFIVLFIQETIAAACPPCSGPLWCNGGPGLNCWVGECGSCAVCLRSARCNLLCNPCCHPLCDRWFAKTHGSRCLWCLRSVFNFSLPSPLRLS